MKKITLNLLIISLILFIKTVALAKPTLNLYLDMPYILNPLGEGPTSPYAPKPLLREDGFDCTTYVETVLARYYAQNSKTKFNNNLMLLRYIDGKIDFFSRAHLMEFQWIPNAIKYNFIRAYPLAHTKNTNFNINLRQWFLQNTSVKHKDSIYIQKANQQPEKIVASVPYIPAKKITSVLLNNLPDFMLVFFIKSLPANSWAGQNQAQELITHMGILINNKLYHASIRNKKVQQIDLLEYLKNTPSFIGVSFYEISSTIP